MDQRILIALDEAGYGPNLGPLVIGASVWQVPCGFECENLTRDLAPVFAALPWNLGDLHIPLGDSKCLYNSSLGLRSLEIGVHSMFQIARSQTQEFDSLFDLIGNDNAEAISRWPWYAQVESEPFSVETDQSVTQSLVLNGKMHLDEMGIVLLEMRTRLILESDFNQSVRRLGSKGQLLSMRTLALATELAEKWRTAWKNCPIEVYCDRQGGRKNYLPILLEAMPDEWFDPIQETQAISQYRTRSEPKKTFHFTVGGDGFPPVGLASMIAKYLRERLMRVLNRYWQSQVPKLRPTAGYPQDAKRFRQAIESVASEKGFALDDWWRMC